MLRAGQNNEVSSACDCDYRLKVPSRLFFFIRRRWLPRFVVRCSSEVMPTLPWYRLKLFQFSECRIGGWHRATYR